MEPDTESSTREEILRRLPSPNGMYAIQAANIDRRTDQTGTWLLEKAAYKIWKETKPAAGRQSRLWLWQS